MKKQKRISFNHFENIITSFQKKVDSRKIVSKMIERVGKKEDFSNYVLFYFQFQYLYEDIIRRYKRHPFKSASKSINKLNDKHYLKLSYMFCIKDANNLIRTNPENAEYIKIKLSIKFDGAKNDSKLYRMLIKI